MKSLKQVWAAAQRNPNAKRKKRSKNLRGAEGDN